MASFPFYKQLDAMDCGPTCLRMIAKYYGRNYSLQTLRDRSFITREGVSMLGISDAAESIGFRTMGVSLTIEQLIREAPKPLILHWEQNHFVVLFKATKTRIYIADPAFGIIKYSHSEFRKNWISNLQEGKDTGLALLLEPKPEFYAEEGEKLRKGSFRFLLSYLRPYRKFINQLIIGIVIAGLIQLILPFLTQAIVDFGINNSDQSFIFLILLAQLVLILSRQSVEFIRGWILLHLSTRINISLISDFLLKLMKLPMSFFDTKLIGDLLQRIGDHKRVESFLTTSSLDILFALFSLFIFSIVLAVYSIKIFLIFIFGSILYFVWIYAFMKRRRTLDFKRFSQQSENQSKLIQIINGIDEIKLNNAEKKKRWEWESVQASLFKVNVKVLSLNQYQQAGAVLINEVKNILITFFAATAVVEGNMTLGMMLAVSYILGQLNGPIERAVWFLRTGQDAKISLERLAEIHNNEDEEKEDTALNLEPTGKSISFRDLSFRYEGPHSKMVLKDINLEIPENSVTAFVGVSGSGKTTLLKLLLGYYQPTQGDIKIGDQSIRNINTSAWRKRCGTVLQDGFIFSDTIAGNIALGRDEIDTRKLVKSAQISNISEFIENLPLGYNTRIGNEGQMISGGEKQRILIARAVYKDPDYLILDEGTSSLDANNERQIMENLEEIYRGKTVIIVAHRLSTVKNADQIVVLDNGQVVETGNHQQLTRLRGKYFQLVKNQLEMGS